MAEASGEEMTVDLQVALFRGPSLVSRFIRWQTRSRYSHCSIVFPDGACFESREFIGVRQTPRIMLEAGETADIFTIEVTPQAAETARNFCEREIGCGYDWEMVWHFVTRGGPVRASETRWFCSEFVYAALEKAGFLPFRDTRAWEVSPGLLSRWARLWFSRTIS